MLDVTAVVCSLVILSIISILLNTFCIYIIKTSTKFHEKPSSVFVMNLLITHLFQSIFVFPLYAGKKLKVENFYLAQFFSNGFRLSYMLSFYAVCLCVLNIAIDRFLATYWLTAYKVHVTYKSIVRTTSITWLYVVLLCMIPFIPHSGHRHDSTIHNNITYASLQKDTAPRNNGSLLYTHGLITSNTMADNLIETPKMDVTNRFQLDEIEQRLPTFDETKGDEANGDTTNSSTSPPRTFYYYVPQKEWTIFMLVFNAALPLVITISCYVYIVYRLRELSSVRTNIVGSPKTMKEYDKRKQVTYLTFILTITYTMCWSPSIIYYTLLSVCEHICFVKNWDNSNTETFIVYIIKYVSFLNSLFSPLIYCYHQPELHLKLFKLKRVLWRKDVLLWAKHALLKRKQMPVNKQTITIKSAGLENIVVPVNQTY